MLPAIEISKLVGMGYPRKQAEKMDLGEFLQALKYYQWLNRDIGLIHPYDYQKARTYKEEGDRIYNKR